MKIASFDPGTAVIVRTFSAGVHFGWLVRRDGREVQLTKARRIWRWYGANTLSELALHGLDPDYSRVAEPVEILLTEAIELIACEPSAIQSIEGASWRP